MRDLAEIMSEGRPALSREELHSLFALLRKFCASIDQFALLRLETDQGDFFVDIGMARPPGVDPESYVFIPQSVSS